MVGTVIPSIRRTGGYGTTGVAAALSDPATLRQLLIENTSKVLSLQAENAVLAPKAEALDRIALAEGNFCITDAAKALKIRRNDLIHFRTAAVEYRRIPEGPLVAYQSKIDAGLLQHKLVPSSAKTERRIRRSTSA